MYSDNPLKVLDYKIEKIQILTSEQRKEIEELDSSYKNKDLLLGITYLVKTENGAWAGDAETLQNYNGEKGWSRAGNWATYDDGILECFTGW